LQAKRNAEAVKRKERELLFADVQEGSTKSGGRKKGQEKFSQDEQLVNAASDVTSALRRTHQLMQSELQRSQFARETLRMS
jgi:protein transport protein SEC20